MFSWMFVPCIIRRSRNDQQYALICTTPLFYTLAPACFGRSLPSSGSFLDPSELRKIQIELVVYHIMCGYVTCVPDCHGNPAHRSRSSSLWRWTWQRVPKRRQNLIWRRGKTQKKIYKIFKNLFQIFIVQTVFCLRRSETCASVKQDRCN
jgi:hypothetical protein